MPSVQVEKRLDAVNPTSAARVAVFAAMPWECRPLLRHLQQVRRERIGNFTIWRARTLCGDVVVMKTGVGPRNAHEAVTALTSSEHFDAFISTGCAGGLSSHAASGDVVIATLAVSAATGEQFVTDLSLSDRVHTVATQSGLTVHRGPMLCVEQALSTSESKRLAAAKGNIAVEMEGAAIAACAAATRTPYVALRSILDGADTELGADGKFIDPATGAVKPFALAKYVATNSGALSNLLAMQRMMQAAQRSLDRFFAAWFGLHPSTSIQN